ncbi:MAG: excalibur calcium-binding domain-containing protein [Patescibacteria group bacterium]
MNTSLKNGLIGAGVIGALAVGGYALMGSGDKTTESDTDYSTTRTNLSTGGADKDCGDFSTHAEAQAFFDSAGPGDPHGLDRDEDGLACETLP